MQALMKRHRLWTPCVLLLLTFALALYAQFSLAVLPNTFQYLWPAPALTQATGGDANTTVSTNGGLKQARLNMEALLEALEGACDPITLYAVGDGVSVIADQDGATAVATRLEAIDDGAYAIKPLLLTSGRLIYSEEFLRGAHVAILDEKLAVALFNYAEPIDRTLLVNGVAYRIVGVVNDHRQVGDHYEHTLYLPYRAMENSATVFSALCIQANPIPNAGGWAAFESATENLSTQGTAISIVKEKMNAAMPLRVLGCLFGLMALWFGIRALNTQAGKLYRAYRLRLRDQYAVRLLPWLGIRGVALGAGYAVCALAFAQLFITMVAPVYTFPEWIPTVLVEPADIATAFWNVWQKQAALMEIRSPELIRTRYFASIMGWACGGMAVAGGLLAARLSEMLKAWTTKPDIAQTPALPEE